MKKVILFLAIIIPLIIGAFIVLISIGTRDISEPRTGDLEIVRTEPEGCSNAYVFLVSAGNLLKMPTGYTPLADYLAGEEVPEAYIAGLLEYNTGALAVIDRAVACNSCRLPANTGYHAVVTGMLG